MASTDLRERFTDGVRMSLGFADQEARRLNHAYIGTEHMLLGMLKEGKCVAAQVLRRLGADLAAARREVESLIQPVPDARPVLATGLPKTPRARRVVAEAMNVARELGHNYVGTEHILLAFLREREGVAFAVLVRLGLTPEGIHREALRLISTMPRGPDGGPAQPLAQASSAPRGEEALGQRLARLEAQSRAAPAARPLAGVAMAVLAIVAVIILALAIYAALRTR